jgi:hypothetical protein
MKTIDILFVVREKTTTLFLLPYLKEWWPDICHQFINKTREGIKMHGTVYSCFANLYNIESIKATGSFSKYRYLYRESMLKAMSATEIRKRKELSHFQ